MNNNLKGLLVGAFILLIALLLLSKCHSCGHPREIADVTPPDTDVVAPQPEPEPEDSVFDANDYGGNGVLKVTLAWEFPGDIDLHVYEPGGNHIYFANRRNPDTTGWLDMDNLEGGRRGEPAVENVFWDNPPSGRYRVAVKYFSTRQGVEEGDVLVVIQVNGEESRYNIHLDEQGEEVDVATVDYAPPTNPQQR